MEDKENHRKSLVIFHIDTPDQDFIPNKLISLSRLDHRPPPTHLVVGSSCPLLDIRCCSRLKHHFIFLLLSPKTCNRYSFCVFAKLMFQLACPCIPCLELTILLSYLMAPADLLIWPQAYIPVSKP